MATRFDQIMAEFSGGRATPLPAFPEPVSIPDEKKNTVAEAAARKRQELGGEMPSPDEMYRVAAARRNGTGAGIESEIGQDLRTGSAFDIWNKYGSRAGSILSQSVQADTAYTQDKTSYRTNDQAVSDTIRGVGLGVGNSIFGIGALGLGLVNDDAGNWAAKKVEDFNRIGTGNQSAGLNNRRRANAVVNELDFADNTAQYEDDIKSDGKFVASLKRIGRDAYSATSNILEDGALTTDLFANAGGSLLTGGPLSGVLKAAGRAALKGATKIGASAAVTAKIASIGSKSAMPVTIGAMEAGGAYQQTVNEAYAQLSGRTDLTEDQKIELANKAGLNAAAIQAPIGVATGLLTSKFEASPFRVGGVGNAASNILKETVEEGIQSGTGQMATNIGIQNYVDQTQDLSEGVGEQTGLGALGGMGAGVGVQVPGASLRTAIAAAKLVGRGAIGIGRAVTNRADRAIEIVEAQSPVSAQAMDAAMDKAAADSTTIFANISDVLNNTDADEPKKAEAFDYLNNLSSKIAFNDDEADTLPPALGEAVRGSTNRFDAIRRASTVAMNEAADAADRISAGVFLLDNIRKNQELLFQDLPDAIGKIPDDHPALAELRAFEDVVINLQSHPQITAAIQAALQLEAQPEAVTEEAIATPQGRQAVQNAVGIANAALDPNKSAEAAIKKINPEINDQILYHAEQGKIELSPQNKQMLQASSALVRAEQTHTQDAEKLGLTTTGIVSRQIQTDKDTGQAHKSAAAHMQGIVTAMRAGDNADAAVRLKRFMSFVQSMQNKVAALNDNLVLGNGSDKNSSSYQAYNPNTDKWFPNPVFLRGNSVGSARLAQQIAIDAKAVATLANNLATTFPELDVAPVEAVELNSEMMLPAKDAVENYKNKVRAQRATSASESTASSEEIVQPISEAEAVEIERQSNIDKRRERDLDVAEFEMEAMALKAARRAKGRDPKIQTNPDEIQMTLDEVAENNNKRSFSVQNQSPTKNEEEVPQSEKTDEDRTQSQDEKTTDQSEVVETPADKVSSILEESASQPEDQRTSTDQDLQATEVVPVVIVQPFADLLGSEDNKPFTDTFELPKGEEPISRVAARDDAIEAVREALASSDSLRQFTGTKKANRLTDTIADAYERLLSNAEELMGEMDSRLNTMLTKQSKFISSDSNWFNQPQYQAANITDNIDGKIEYNPALQQAAVLAGLQWLLTADQRRRPLDAEEVAKILGLQDEATEDQVKDFNQGLYLAGEVATLGGMIERYWGVRIKKDATIARSKGIPEGVAKEVLLAMQEAGYIKIHEITNDVKLYYQIENLISPKIEKDENGKIIRIPGIFGNAYDELIKFPDLIELAVLTEPEETIYLGDSIPPVSKNQLRNSLVKLTDQQIAMQEAEQKTNHYFDTTMLNMINILDNDGAVALFAHGDLEKKQLNEKYKSSLDSVNSTIVSAIESIRDTYKAVVHEADVTGQDIDQVAIHYPYEFTSVNRLQMIGKQNPQANKLTREVIAPTRSTLDLSNENSEDMGRFMLGLAQAWGVKVHKQVRAVSVQKAREMLSGDLAPAIKLLRELLLKQDASKALSITDKDIQMFRMAFNGGKDKPVPPMAFRAALEYARLQNTNNRSEFTTFIYVEADGITDGPINAMVHMATGAFTKKWLEIVRKGGLFLGVQNQTANTNPDSVDFYAYTNQFFKKAMQDLKIEVQDDYEVRDQMNALINLMIDLEMDIRIEDGNLVIDRGVVKNPVTVSIYGAGPAGIANKVATTLEKALYERQTQLSDKSWKAVQKLTQNIVDRSKKGGLRFSRLGSDNRLSNKSLDYAFDKAEMKNLTQNILTLFVAPMRNAIDAASGETTDAVTSIRQATQVQGIYLQYAFERALARLNEEKKGKITQADINGIYTKLKHLTPYIETGTQNMFVAGSERVNMRAGATPDKSGRIRDAEFSRALDGSLSTPAYTYGPVDPGVSGIPYTVISTGDGQMMQNFTVDLGEDGKHLLIFDGANFSLDKLEVNSEKINKAVYDGWMNNPLGSVAKSFGDFIQDADLENIDPKQLEALTFALWGPEGKGKNEEAVIEEIKALNTRFQNMSDQIAARKRVLARIQMSVDHMASAEAPFNAQGEDFTGMDDTQIEARLNQMLDEEIANQEEKPSENIESNLENQEVIFADDLIGLVRKMNVPANQKGLLIAAAKALRGSGWKVVVEPKEGDVLGSTNFNERTIYLNSLTSETLLHEMIHASTLEKVFAHYNGETLPTQEAEAIQRIDGLMRDWLENTDLASDLNENIRQAYANAQHAVRSKLGDGNASTAVAKATALNEFMAWVLANQSLARMAERTKVNPVYRIAREALRIIKALIQGKLPAIRDDLYSNLRFNTSILLSDARPMSAVLGDTILYQSTAFGTNDRLTALREAFEEKMTRYAYTRPLPSEKLAASQKAQQAVLYAKDILTSFNAHGFPMTPQESSTFEMLVAAFATEVQLDPNAMSRAQTLYAHVSKTLKVEDFMVDPVADEQADRFQAQEKYNSILGTNLTIIDQQGRSTLLPAFLALANVNDGLRAVLAQMDLPKGESLPNDGLDNRLTNAATDLLDGVTVFMSGEGLRATSIGVALDNLTRRLVEIGQDDNDKISEFVEPVDNFISKLNDKVVGAMQTGAKKVASKMDDVKANTSRKSVAGAAEIVKVLASIVDKDTAGDVAKGMMSFMNDSKVWKPIHELMNELVGRTDENAPIYDMIKRVRSVVQGARQQFREHLPELIQKRFTRVLEDAEYTAMFKGMAKTDIAALRSIYSVDEIIELFRNPSKIAQQTVLIENRISKSHSHSNVVLTKSKQLADYMIMGRAGSNLLRNATAIANLYGEGTVVRKFDAAVVRDIDHLVSLYALEGLNKNDKDILSSLVQDQKDGVSFVLAYLEGQRVDELRNAGSGRALINHYKGFIPSEQSSSRSMIVANDSEYTALRQKGYQRVADYVGSAAEYGASKKGYYFSHIPSRAKYAQGIIQTVHTTVSGVDPVTGFTTGSMTAGRIVDPNIVDRVQKLMSKRKGGNEMLLPVYDDTGKLVAYERSVDPLQEQRLERSTNIAEMLGAWRGRQMEEALAERFNESLIDRLFTIYDKTPFIRKNEFVNIFDENEQKKDPVLKDAASLIPRDTREYIESVYGEKAFYVRRDMINDAIGYRTASIGDAWTGNTRWPAEMQKVTRNIATSVFGIDAYKRMIQAETLYTNFITDARVTIVVKSVVVPVANLVANIYQLSANGVPLAKTTKGMGKKTAEVNAYMKDRIRKIEIEAELRASNNSVVATRLLTTELQSIEDSWKRLSVWPLIEAGELTSISDVGIGKEEIDIAEGRLNAYVESLTDKLPDAVKTLGKYAVIGKDTALFKGLQRTVEYGDFLAKAILYDHLMEKEKLSSADALGRVSEEFVNYDRLPGRTRGALESLGMMWFWNFKIRSTKVGLAMIRNNPVHAMFSMLAPSPPFIGNVGNPITDNIVSVGIDGRLDNSLGPNMAWSAHTMNPWWALIN